MRSLWGKAIPVLVSCCIASASATAQKADKPDRFPVRVADGAVAPAAVVPDSATIYFALDNAAQLRNQPVGRFVHATLTAFIPEGEIRSAWNELSRALEMTPDRTFDRLLGKRVVYVARKTPDGSHAWAILAEVDPRTERDLRRSLKPAPRDIVKGRPILALENGAFLLTAERQRKGPSLILLGPRDNAKLFTEIAYALGGIHKHPLAARPEFEKAHRLDANADAILFTRMPDHDSWMGLTFSAANRTVQIKGLTSSTHNGAPHHAWTDEQFERVSEGALVAFMDDALFTSLPFDPAAMLALGDFKDFEGDDLLSGRWVLTLKPEPDHRLSFTHAQFTHDLPALAPKLDKMITTVVAQQSGDPAYLEAGFDDFPTPAMRTLKLPAAPGGNPDPEMSWRFVADPAAAEQAGWWILANRAQSIEPLASALTEPASDTDPPIWVSRGFALPAQLASHIAPRADKIPAFALLAAPLAQIDSISWRASQRIADTRYIQVTINLTDPAAPRADSAR